MANQIKIVILAGPPGSGKGTQAHLLKDRKGFYLLQTSQVIREKFKTDPDNPDVKASKKAYQEGGLTDGAVLARWIGEKLLDIREQILTKGVILDGAARTTREAQSTFELIKENFGADKLRLFFIKVSAQETLRRNSKRLICEKCLRPLNPKLIGKVNKCPHCGGKLVPREMDNQEIIQKRLEVYEKQTLPAINFLKKQGVVIEINGEQPVESVYRDIEAHLD
jgi:adenylate kinase